MTIHDAAKQTRDRSVANSGHRLGAKVVLTIFMVAQNWQLSVYDSDSGIEQQSLKLNHAETGMHNGCCKSGIWFCGGGKRRT